MQKRISTSLCKFNHSFLKSVKIHIVSFTCCFLSTSHPLLEANYNAKFLFGKFGLAHVITYKEVEDLPFVNTQTT